jgi:hypothetical protein
MTIDGWRRTCPGCGTCDGDQVERIAYCPAFRCTTCGHVWDGSGAKLVFLTRPLDPDDDEGIDALVDLLLSAAGDALTG